jgi:1-deoxy-D-xylulose-5-phosphate reductoisomerase
LSFETVRYADFPMLQLGINAGRRGGAAPAVFNAANEVAVAHFLAGRLSFSGIAERVSAALHEFAGAPGASLDELLRADAAARDHVNAQVGY